MTDLAKDLEFWMTNLPPRLRLLPVIHLAIPGSHDSTTFALNKHSTISPDARSPIQYLKFLEPLLQPVMLKWSKTQTVNISEQLRAGIRYFDLRIAMKPHCKDFFFVHNLYSESVGSVFEHIAAFLRSHPREIVVLDFQHFYDLTTSDHKRLVDLLAETFGGELLPFREDMTDVTLDSMARDSHQVIAVYRAEARGPTLWPGKALPTPWPDTVDVPKLITFLSEELESRDDTVGFVSQCVLTPTVWFALKHIFGCLRSKCVLPLEAPKYQWLKLQRPGPHGLNVVISDFIEDQDFTFPKEVINLNNKLRGGEPQF